MTRGRFAPSPTGGLHLGLARTALLAWLGARSEGGSLLLRIEDLDGPRVVAGSAEAQMRDLRWLGLDWDEGPDVGGPHAPYVQSERSELYLEAIAALRADGRAFDCTCSRKEIAVASAPHGASEYGPRYPGTCRSGPSHPHPGRKAAVRFRVPDALPDFVDGVQGPSGPGLAGTDHGAQGDFVVQRADGLFSYQLAVVVDDARMGVDQVVRGSDLLGCTAWQIALYEALGLAVPRFYHVPLLLGPSHDRLAKRAGAIHLGAFREHGWSPPRLLGWLAHSLGWAPADSECSLDDLLKQFAWDRLPTGDTPMPAGQLP